MMTVIVLTERESVNLKGSILIKILQYLKQTSIMLIFISTKSNVHTSILDVDYSCNKEQLSIKIMHGFIDLNSLVVDNSDEENDDKN